MARPSPRVGELFDAECLALDEEGSGVAELAADEVLRVHVTGVLPGERFRARLEHVSVHRRADHREAWASPSELLLPSPERVEIACPAYGPCGGCTLMALAYPAQLAWKTEKVRAALLRAGLAAVAVEPCVASPEELGYRNQAKYVYGRDRTSGQAVLGAFAPRSHEVVDLAGCRTVEPILEQSRAALLASLVAHAIEPFDEIRRVGILRYAVLRSTAAGQVMVTLVAARSGWAEAEPLARELRDRCPAVVSVVLNVNGSSGNVLFGGEERTLSGAAFLEDRVGDVRVRLSSRSFFQANRPVASAIYRVLAGMVADDVGRAVDAYAGAGGIALSLAGKAREVIAIEHNAAATAAAADFLAEQSEGRVRTMTGDAGVCLRSVPAADVVVLNPPRRGCSDAVLAAVGALRPATLLYLSCNPATLARDLAVLVAAGARLEHLLPFDMMPHTPHVETLACLRFDD